MYEGIAAALVHLLLPENLLWIALGTILGLITGALPGVSGVSMMALMLPFTFGMPPEIAVLMLIGVYASSTYSNSIGGIVYNIPGGAAGIPTTLEGYQLTRRGRLGEALTTNLYASFIGSTIGFVGTVILTPLFILVATQLGTAERGLFALLALILVGTGALSRADPARGLLAIALGLLLGTIGMQSTTGFVRFVRDYPEFWDGLHLVWIIVGLYAVPQIFRLATVSFETSSDDKASFHYSALKETGKFLRYFSDKKFLLLRTGVLGAVVGALPGLGTVAATWLGYQEAYRSSKDKDTFGKGAVDGIAGAETSNNAAVPTTLVPLLALGIPGSAAAALVLGAFLLAGVQPGPQMLKDNPVQVWTILLGLFLTGFMFIIFGLPLHKMVAYITRIKSAYLIPAVVAFSSIGTYLATGFIEGIYVALAIGIVATFAERLKLPISNVLLGAVLGPTIEHELLTAYNIGGWGRFLQTNSFILLIVIALLLVWGFAKNFVPSLLAILKSDGDASKVQTAPAYDLLLGSLGVAIGLWVASEAAGFPLAAGVVPYTLGVYVILPMAGILILKGALSAKRFGLSYQPARGEGVEDQYVRFDSLTIAVMIAVSLSIILIGYAGFLPAMAALAVVIGLLLRVKILHIAAYTVALVIGFMGFGNLFGVVMPEGQISSWLQIAMG